MFVLLKKKKIYGYSNPHTTYSNYLLSTFTFFNLILHKKKTPEPAKLIFQKYKTIKMKIFNFNLIL